MGLYSNQKSSKGGLYSSTQDLSSSRGLYGLAVQSGLQKQADEIVAKNQGETNQIFSGGIVSDFFDVLNTLDYGVVGLLKGKSFLEGIKNRESFADEDALGGSLGGTILGTILDIAVDPLTYTGVGLVSKVGKLTGLSKVAGAISKATKGKIFGNVVEKMVDNKMIPMLEGGTRVGKFLADKFAYMFSQGSDYAKMWNRTEKAIGASQTTIKQMSRGILNLNKEQSEKLLSLGSDYRFDRTGIEDLKKTGLFDDESIKEINRFQEYIDELGTRKVELGQLDNATYLENKGKYLKAFYKTYEEAEPQKFASLQKKVSKQYKRKDLTPEEIMKLGRVDNPAYIFSKTAMLMAKDVEMGRFFDDVAQKFAIDGAGKTESQLLQEGFEKIGSGVSKGSLSGKYVPTAIAKDINALIQPIGEVEKVLNPITKAFKYMKVVLNPASHVRNVLSNKLLNNFDEAGLPLWRLDKDMQGWKSVIKKDKWYQEVEKMGGAVDTFSAQELGDLLEETGRLAKVKGGINKAVGFFSDLYQREEMGAKMSMYIFQRGKGLNPEEAWKIAERATFNYAQVTPFIRKMRSSLFGFPFITFTVKATPVIAKTVAKHPTKISNIGKIKNSIEKLSNTEETEKERANEPDWVKNGFYVKLPWKDKEGRSAYFDLTYILPFGDLVNLGDETNLNVFSKSPALNLIKELGNNKDFYGNKIWQESATQSEVGTNIMRHLVKTFAPPLVADQLPGGFNPMTNEQQKGKIAQSLDAMPDNQKRDLMQELLRMAGMKIQPMNADIQETYNEWNTRRDLETLLNENQITKQFSKTYVPK